MPKLKILSVGLGLDGPTFDSYSFAEAPSLSDYDAVVVDLEAVSELVSEVFNKSASPKDRSGLPIVPEAKENAAGAVSISELLRRREREANTLMQNAGVLVCFAHPSVSYTIERQQWFIYDWLPRTPNTRFYRPDRIVAGDGEIGRVDSSHPFTQFFSAYYRVFFDEKFTTDHPSVKVIAQARSGEPVAVEFIPNQNIPGRIMFLPPISEFDLSDQQKAAGVIQDCIVAGLDRDTSDFAPEWVERLEMPGLTALDDAVANIEQEIKKSEGELAKAKEERDVVARYKKLLWATGKHQLEPVVREALSVLGFDVTEEGDRDAVLFYAGTKLAIAEVEGSTGPVDVGKYRQLLDYVQDELLESGNLVKGVLIGNGFRLQAPEDRDVQFTERCQLGAEQQKYCLLDTTQLFEATKAVLAGSSEEIKTRIRQDILNTSGIYRYSNPN